MPQHMDLSKFHVLCIVSNPFRFSSRWKLHQIFQEDIIRKGAKIWTVELATGCRIHKVTELDNDQHLQVWSSGLTGSPWLKENMLNIGIQHIIKAHPDARYFAWVDADCKWEPGMISEAQHALQHWDFIQLFSHSIDLGPQNEIVGNVQTGFMYGYFHNKIQKSTSGYTAGYGHPGYGYAARRDALNKVGVSICNGPLIDFGILGSADRHMACALIGRVEWSYHHGVHANYRKWLHLWQDVAEKNIKRNVGYLTQTIRHMWHSKKANRGYATRWKLIVDLAYDPETDLRRDVSGIWLMNNDTPRQCQLRDATRKYTIARNEDSIDV